MAKKITQEQVLEAIRDSHGLISKVQSKLIKIVGDKMCWDTVEKYVHKWEATEAAIKAEKEAMLDIAESQIFKELKSGDTATAKWYLRMKGKERGYEDSSTFHLDSGDPLNINFSGENSISKDELVKASNVELGKSDGE